jgi:hypothetical protein
MSDGKLLKIYLSDHLAGATAGYELAKRSLTKNGDNDLGSYLRKLVKELEADKISLEQVIARVGGSKSRVKLTAAWTAEKIGRLKLNGSIASYSDLSRLLEVEGLCLGVEGKLSLWRALKQTASSNSLLNGFDFDRLIERATAQRHELEGHRLRAAAQAFGIS